MASSLGCTNSNSNVLARPSFKVYGGTKPEDMALMELSWVVAQNFLTQTEKMKKFLQVTNTNDGACHLPPIAPKMGLNTQQHFGTIFAVSYILNKQQKGGIINEFIRFTTDC